MTDKAMDETNKLRECQETERWLETGYLVVLTARKAT